MRWIQRLLVLSAGIIALNFGMTGPAAALGQSSGDSSASTDRSNESSSDESDDDAKGNGTSRTDQSRRHATGTTTGRDTTSQDRPGHSSNVSNDVDESGDDSDSDRSDIHQSDTGRSETDRDADRSSDDRRKSHERSSAREEDRFDERARDRTRLEDSDHETAAGERNFRSSRNESDETTRDRESASEGRNGRRYDMGAKFTTDDNDRVELSSLESDSILARAGLRRGDIIRSVNGQRVNSRESLDRWVHQANPTEPLAFAVLREGRERTVHVDFAGQSQRNAYSYSKNNDAHRAALGVLLDMRYAQDAIVQRVYRDSPADRAGIRPGDEITSINGQDIYSPQHLMSVIAELEPGTPVEVEYTRRVRRVTDVDLASRQVLHDRGGTTRDNRIGRRSQPSSDESDYDSRETNDNSDESRSDSHEELE